MTQEHTRCRRVRSSDWSSAPPCSLQRTSHSLRHPGDWDRAREDFVFHVAAGQAFAHPPLRGRGKGEQANFAVHDSFGEKIFVMFCFPSVRFFFANICEGQ